MVQLNSMVIVVFGLLYVEFQFHYGSIKFFLCPHNWCPLLYFNSTMVQLNSASILCFDKLTPFQFHYFQLNSTSLSKFRLPIPTTANQLLSNIYHKVMPRYFLFNPMLQCNITNHNVLIIMQCLS